MCSPSRGWKMTRPPPMVLPHSWGVLRRKARPCPPPHTPGDTFWPCPPPYHEGGNFSPWGDIGTAMGSKKKLRQPMGGKKNMGGVPPLHGRGRCTPLPHPSKDMIFLHRNCTQFFFQLQKNIFFFDEKNQKYFRWKIEKVKIFIEILKMEFFGKISFSKFSMIFSDFQNSMLSITKNIWMAPRGWEVRIKDYGHFLLKKVPFFFLKFFN